MPRRTGSCYTQQEIDDAEAAHTAATARIDANNAALAANPANHAALTRDTLSAYRDKQAAGFILTDGAMHQGGDH